MQKKYESKGLLVREKDHLGKLVGKRNRYLRLLRQDCYKKFEWLLEQLDIMVKPTVRLVI